MKKFAMSAIGYAIAVVIMLGVVMIISTPMLVDSAKKEEKPSEPVQTFEPTQNDYSEFRELVNRLSLRIDNLERNQTVTDKYVCTIEGDLDEDGNIVPVDNYNRTKKFVFVCEYRR